MTRTGLPLVVAFVLMAKLAVDVGGADAQPLPSEFRASGSFVAGGTSIDTNDDGITADLFIISGESLLLGPLTNQAVVEWTFDDEPVACALGTVLEGTLVLAGSAVVTRVTERQPPSPFQGNLLFGTFTSGTSCISETGMASVRAEGIFTRGTGRLANATGNFTLTATVTPLLAGQEDDRGSRARRRSDRGRPRSSPTFGSVEVTVQGTINLNP